MIEGTTDPNFAEVATAFRRLLPAKGHAGASVCVYHRGQKVVDLWGGTTDDNGSRWQQDTTAPCFSTTKGVVSTALHVLVDRGLADYDDPIAKHWPEFATRGKEAITIRQALCHEAGLYRITDMIRRPTEMLNWEHMKSVLANAEPAHTPGQEHGYHAITYGWLIGGLIEAISGQSLADFLASELAEPLGLDGLYIGMPPEELGRRALLAEGRVGPPAAKAPWRERVSDFVEAGLERVGVQLSEFRSALLPFSESFDFNAEEVALACIPAANGQFTARSLARMYAMLAGHGELDGVRLLSDATVREIGVVRNRTRDNVLFLPMRWRMGFHRVFAVGVRAPQGFGHYGYGGSGAFCDPSRELSAALVVNWGAGSPTGDSRTPRIAGAALRCADRVGK